MKKLIIAFLLLPFVGFAQYRESGDTIFVNNKMLLPGDTVHLGMGSDPYKKFLFVKPKPTIFNSSISDGVASGPQLGSSVAFKWLLYKGMQITGKRAKKYGTGYPTFWLNGMKGAYNTCYIEFLAAISSKEIINF